MNNIPSKLSALNRKDIFQQSTEEVRKRLKTFDQFAHKGTRGHAAIIAGSDGMMGASILATSSCMRSGCGKTTSIIPQQYYSLIHAAVPEALVRDNNDKELDLNTFDAIAIGPGIGITNHSRILLEKVFQTGKSMVIDADALNIISQTENPFSQIPYNAILTPHHKEWERLVSKTDDDYIKINTSLELCNKFNINILLKGYFSVFVTPSNFFINGTGNAGMGKAGSGDVLTGILASLLAQGYTPEDAGIIGMYIHGLAGDIAKENLGEDYMTASDIIHYLSASFISIRN